MYLQSRGFGTAHHAPVNPTQDSRGTELYQHITSILSIVIAGTTLFGTIAIIVRNAQALIRGRNNEEVGQQTTKAKGPAKRTRATLLIALLCADGWIATSWIAPAVMDLVDRPLKGAECQAPGIALASALWWQYSFSIAIALSTYLAVRHPLSPLKKWQEEKVGLVICALLAIGVVQAISWDQLHGYTNWGQFCYYGLPRSRLAEVMQFLPRLLSSLIIAVVYASLIHFLRRPDITARCTPPCLGQSSSYDTLCDTSTAGPIPKSPAEKEKAEDIPPWEKMVLPDYSKLMEDGESMSPTQRIVSRLSTPERAWLKGSRFSNHTRSISSISERTLTPSSRPASATADIISTRSDILQVPKPTRPARPLTAPSAMAFGHKPVAEPIRSSHSLPLNDEQVSRRTSLATSDASGEVASFRGMLADACGSDSAPPTRPCTPVIDEQGRIESRADVLNKQTWKLLIWFPLTHAIIFVLTLARLIWFAVREESDDADAVVRGMDILTIVVIMGQGIADLIVFGLIEQQ